MKKVINTVIRAFFLILVFFQTEKLVSSGHAIIGGNDNNSSSPYAALVSPEGTTSFLSGSHLPTGNGFIRSVAINDSGFAIIGGGDSNGVYVALVDKNGATKTLSGLPVLASGSFIASTAINSSGDAVIGGRDIPVAYGALVKPDGTIISLSGPNLPATTGNGVIRSVAINDSGYAIIGGQNNAPPIANKPYISLVDPNGVTTALSGSALPAGAGTLYSVAINSSNFAIIGGAENRFSFFYAALVDPNGVTTALSGPAAPTGRGQILSVAINDSRASIIGGNSSTSSYAALVDSNGVTTALTGPAAPTGPGRIASVDINPSSASIIGGVLNSHPFAALVDPNGVTRALSGSALPVGSGQISSVAINASGCAIIGGNVDNKPYVALVAPNGSTTPLSGAALPIEDGAISSVSINNFIEKFVDPKGFGAGSGYANPLFTLSAVVLKKRLSLYQNIEILSSKDKKELSLTADRSDKIRAPHPYRKNEKFAIWASPFGFFSKYEEQHSFPSMKNKGIGGILGFDYHPWENGVFGGGVAYAYQTFSSSENQGKSHQELITLYTAIKWKKLLVQGALSGGVYQLDNCRKTLASILSKSSIRGGLFAPHFNAQYPMALSKLSLIPFLELDWVNNWQGAVKEQGKSGLNLRIASHYTSVLRTGVGVLFQQQRHFKQGTLKLEQGISYVNKKPFWTREVPTFYVGSVSTFDIQLFSNQTQNLGSFSIGSSFIPTKDALPLFSINYQGEWGKKQLFNVLAAEIKKNF